MARFEAFIGGSYESQAVTADQERTINWYPEKLQSAGATAQTVLYPSPGVEAITTVLPGNGRAHFAMAGREFAVIGTTLWEIGTTGLTTSRGTVALDENPATINSNGDGGNQLFITSGGYGYSFDLGTNVLTQITALNGRATMGGYLDGYFLCLDAKTSTLYISALMDGTSWTIGSDFAQRSLAPDPWRAMKVVGRYIWLFGEYTTEIWQDTGATFPFAPFPDSLFNFGVMAPFSVALLGQGVIWLGNDRAGRVCVIYSTGQTPEVVSTYPLESAFQAYADMSTAVGDCYSDRGHSFYLLSFDRADVTWVWDLETRLWSERGTWISTLNQFTSWRPRFYAFAFNEHRILDSAGGTIYRMSSDIPTDVESLKIRRVRRAPAIVSENKRIYYPSFELDLEPGIASAYSFASFTMSASSEGEPEPPEPPPAVPEGRLIVSTSMEWTVDRRTGYPGYSYSAATIAAHDALLPDVLAWLCETTDPVSLLIMVENPSPDGRPFGADFQAALTRLGHSYSLTGGISTFGSYDPDDFDAVLVFEAGGQSNTVWDTYLDGGGRVWAVQDAGSPDHWLRYGVNVNGFQTNTSSAADYLRQFTNSAFGSGTYSCTLYWDGKIDYAPASKTRSGTSTIYGNNLGQGNFLLWTYT